MNKREENKRLRLYGQIHKQEAHRLALGFLFTNKLSRFIILAPLTGIATYSAVKELLTLPLEPDRAMRIVAVAVVGLTINLIHRRVADGYHKEMIALWDKLGLQTQDEERKKLW